ncbi:MAG: CoA-binding protein, partial [Bacteroidetes bacterium]|nr:CoA-binding protein [Bacteroidota bacterium]
MSKRASKSLIDEFVSLPAVALVGVSSDPKKFGANAFRELIKKGWKVYPVNPKLTSVEGQTCFPDLNSIPEPFAGVISIVGKEKTLRVMEDANQKGIKHVWIQQKSET